MQGEGVPGQTTLPPIVFLKAVNADKNSICNSGENDSRQAFFYQDRN